MTFPLVALAVGATLVGFFGVPTALGGGNAIEHFLEPAFTASAEHGEGHAAAAHEAGASEAAHEATAASAAHEGHGEGGEEHPSTALELGLMAFSVLIALGGISFAWKAYVTKIGRAHV